MKAGTNDDPEAARAEQRITQEIRDRYGVTPEDLRTNVEAECHRSATDRADAEQLIEQANQNDRETDKAQDDDRSLNTASDQLTGIDIEREAGVLCDSASRRRDTASEMEAEGLDPGEVKTRMLADVSQSKPATEAVVDHPKSLSPQARRSRGKGSRQKHTTGLGR